MLCKVLKKTIYKNKKIVYNDGTKWMIVGESGDNMFIGQYNHTIDDKGRIIIPSKIRNDLGNNFIVTRGLDGCLFIYSNIEWENIINKYKNLPDTKEKRNFLRVFLSGASICEYDKQGRINIPSSLIDYAKLSRECIIVGVLDRLEIWSKESWDNFIDNNTDNLSEIVDSLFESN